MMQQEEAFINTQRSGPGPANNRENDDGGQWVWGVGTARMIPSMTIAEQAVGGGERVQREAWGLCTEQCKSPGDSVATTQSGRFCKQLTV